MNSNCFTDFFFFFLLSADVTEFSCLIFFLQEIAKFFCIAATPSSFLNMQNVYKLSSLFYVIDYPSI